jgi:hypothetical protein
MRAGPANLLDDVGDAHLRTEIVAHDRDRDAVREKAAGDMAEDRGLERPPIAAVDEYGELPRISFGAEEVDELPRRRAIRDGELGPALRRHLVAEFFRGRAPALENRRMLRHPRAVVVLGLVVDVGRGHGVVLPAVILRRPRGSRGGRHSEVRGAKDGRPLTMSAGPRRTAGYF